ncbi:MAG: aminoacyl-tRNA hydrolase [Acidimicrobiia bacterium]|nr:aminoacyl-tRNA hydrolase [Acidimicrobiia bacterium]
MRRSERAVESSTAPLLVVGLGNPGRQYEHTRHNVGAQTVQVLARRQHSELRGGRDDATTAEIRLGGERAVLAFPLTYMNESGRAVRAVMRRNGIDDAGRVIVVHDELDLDPGVVRVKLGGGLAGHNGLRSLRDHLHTADFARVRIGVGKPPSSQQGADHVLRKVGKAERELLDVAVERAADAVEMIAEDGVDAAMQRFNARER